LTELSDLHIDHNDMNCPCSGGTLQWAMTCCHMESPVGRLRIVERDEAVVSVTWSDGDETDENTLLTETCRQLRAYFDNELSEFDLPLAPSGSPFQHRVFDAMSDIEFGRTKTYGELAGLVDGSAQAVGQACGANPIPIIIPCHRVLAANGLGGFSGAGGVETKVELLKREGAYSLLI
jgi:methylated-DNA-[protein]-cysteine S-methyltransferase